MRRTRKTGVRIGSKGNLDLDRIRSIPIATVLSDAGIRLPASGIANCPLPDHPDVKPSFQARKGLNNWRCYGCGRGGSVIDLVMHLYRLDLKQSINWLQERYLGGTVTRAPALKSVKISKVTKKVDREYQIDPAVYECILDRSPLQESGRSYLNSRAITNKTLDVFCVGQIGNSHELWDFALKRFGFDRLCRAGLATSHNSMARLVFPSNYLLFPFVVDGRCEYLQARGLGGVRREHRWKCLSGLPPPIFNAGRF